MRILYFIILFFLFISFAYSNYDNYLLIYNFFSNYFETNNLLLSEIESPLSPIDKYLTINERDKIYLNFRKSGIDYLNFTLLNLIPGLGLTMLNKEFQPLVLFGGISLPLYLSFFTFLYFGGIESNSNLKILYYSLSSGSACGLILTYIVSYYILYEFLNNHNIYLNKFLKLNYDDVFKIEFSINWWE